MVDEEPVVTEEKIEETPTEVQAETPSEEVSSETPNEPTEEVIIETPVEETPVEKKKTVDGQSYWHHSLLSNWGKNEEYRLLKQKDWLRLLKSVNKSGVKTKFEIDIDGTVYDGNNRLKAINELISEGVLLAENGKELEWVPVCVHEVPVSEADEIKLATKGNSDSVFAYWNKDTVANNKELFIDVEDDLFFFNEPVTFGEVFETYEINETSESGTTESDNSAPVEIETVREVTCPNCTTKFTI